MAQLEHIEAIKRRSLSPRLDGRAVALCPGAPPIVAERGNENVACEATLLGQKWGDRLLKTAIAQGDAGCAGGCRAVQAVRHRLQTLKKKLQKPLTHAPPHARMASLPRIPWSPESPPQKPL